MVVFYNWLVAYYGTYPGTVPRLSYFGAYFRPYVVTRIITLCIHLLCFGFLDSYTAAQEWK